mgnify:CR=1 FL=1
MRPLIAGDVAEARRLDKAAHALLERLEQAGDRLAQQAIDRLYTDTRRVLDKAKLGKIDAIIGQKRKLDIEVQDLAAGRFPAELIGRLWNASMIGDDEELVRGYVMALLADKLYEGVDYDSVEVKPDDAPLPVAVKQTPLYKRWWFWTAIGVVVAGGASALAVGLTLRQPSCPDGHTCTGNLVYSLTIPF